jgi:hypothetical protein
MHVISKVFGSKATSAAASSVAAAVCLFSV